MKVVGLNAAVTLEKFYELERMFRDHTLQNFQAIEPRSLAHRRFGDAESVFIFPLESLVWVTLATAVFQALISVAILIFYLLLVGRDVSWTVLPC